MNTYGSLLLEQLWAKSTQGRQIPHLLVSSTQAKANNSLAICAEMSTQCFLVEICNKVLEHRGNLLSL